MTRTVFMKNVDDAFLTSKNANDYDNYEIDLAFHEEFEKEIKELKKNYQNVLKDIQKLDINAPKKLMNLFNKYGTNMEQCAKKEELLQILENSVAMIGSALLLPDTKSENNDIKNITATLNGLNKIIYSIKHQKQYN